MTSRKTTSAAIVQCSTSNHGTTTDVLALSQSDVAVLAETFRLLGDQSRLKILLQCMRGSVAVGDIAGSLGVCRTFQVFRALGVSATIGALLPRARPYEPFCPS